MGSLFLAVLLVSLSSAQENKPLVIEKQVIHDVVTMENINIPAEYNFTVNNPNNFDDFFKIYTLLDAKLAPIKKYPIAAGLRTNFVVTLLPTESLKNKCGEGSCQVQYYLKADRSGVVEDTFSVRILPLDKIISINVPSSITRDDTMIIFNVTNKENINFREVQLTFDSEFSKIEKKFTLGPKSSERVEMQLDTTKLKTAKFGDYDTKLKLFINNEYEYVIIQPITLQEFTSITTTEASKFSFFGFTRTITKKNEGNSAKLITIEIVKNRFEHAFTSSSIPATSVEASGALVTLKWQRELEPGESFTLEVYTDYTIPVITLILIILAALGIWLAKRPRVIVKKKAFKVKTKGGEFALKIVLLVKNIGKEIKNVKCIDRVPHMVKIYERFGVAKPDKIEKETLTWNFGDLAPGEERVISYIIYSKIVPVGAITLPRAMVSYTDAKDMRRGAHSNTLVVMGEAK
ncbi:MAG: hypothetical protein K6T16_01685 [Candidatus Pacearchaeota archaeon]|nr:hypothetical protein [Candidatus Pacearchaeota archaeon]